MSHDFARSQRIRKEAPRAPKRKKSKGIPSWLWVLVGTLVGCLIMFLVYLSGVRPPLPAPVLAPQHPATSSETPAGGRSASDGYRACRAADYAAADYATDRHCRAARCSNSHSGCYSSPSYSYSYRANSCCGRNYYGGAARRTRARN